ncbi:MAG: hypothetical protein ACOYXA_14510 [Bacteroidota bacterium]
MIKIEKEIKANYEELTLSSEASKDQFEKVKNEIIDKMTTLKIEGYEIHQNIFFELTDTEVELYTTFAIMRKYK